MRAALDRSRRHLLVVERGLPDLPGILGGLRQRMEDRAERLALALPVLLDRKRGALGRLAPRLPHPREGIANRRAALAALHRRMEFETQRLLERGRTAEALVRFSVAPVRALLREKTLRLDGAGGEAGRRFLPSGAGARLRAGAGRGGRDPDRGRGGAGRRSAELDLRGRAGRRHRRRREARPAAVTATRPGKARCCDRPAGARCSPSPRC